MTQKSKYFCISGMAGVGKSFLLNYIQEQWVSIQNQREFLQMDSLNNILFASSTNKAASVLNDSLTVHKMFKFFPTKNYTTGQIITKPTSGTVDIGPNLLIIDEASLLEEDLLNLVDKYTQNAKVIFVGDEDQLAPVDSLTVPVFNKGYPTSTLIEPMRQDPNSHLFKQIIKLKEAVKTNTHHRIESGPNITFLNGSQFKQELILSFKNHEDSRILSYTNKQVENYNNYVRKKVYGVSDFREGDLVVAANCCKGTTKIEQSYRIEKINGNNFTLNDGITYQVPVNKNQWFQDIKSAQTAAKRSGDWKHYFYLKDNFLDIRDGFSCTVNKSQGSTYSKIFIDLQNLYSCRDLNTLLRLLYVAHSRAKEEIYIYV